MNYPTMVTIPISLDARITPNSRSHWRTKHKIQQEMKHTTQMAMMASGPHSSLHNAPLPLTISYIIGLGFNRKTLDHSNAIASMKYIEDGIAAYLGINDRNFRVGTVEQVRAGKGNQPFIRVLISPAEQPDAQ